MGLSQVKNDQLSWNSKHGECKTALSNRDSRVCTFGHRYQNACAAKQAYYTLKGQIEGTEHIHSVLDRKSESNTVETVLCILEDFIADKVITDESVSGWGTR